MKEVVRRYGAGRARLLLGGRFGTTKWSLDEVGATQSGSGATLGSARVRCEAHEDNRAGGRSSLAVDCLFFGGPRSGGSFFVMVDGW